MVHEERRNKGNLLPYRGPAIENLPSSIQEVVKRLQKISPSGGSVSLCASVMQRGWPHEFLDLDEVVECHGELIHGVFLCNGSTALHIELNGNGVVSSNPQIKKALGVSEESHKAVPGLDNINAFTASALSFHTNFRGPFLGRV